MEPSNDPEVLTTSALFSAIMPIKISMYFRLGGYAKELNYFAADWDFWLSVYEKKLLELKLKLYTIGEITIIMLLVETCQDGQKS